MKKNMMKKPTLLQAVERVVELSRDSKMSDKFMKDAAPEIELIVDCYGITERQAVLFCICMEKGPRRVDYDDLASHLDISKIGVLSYASDIDALVRRRLLRYRDVKEEEDFDVPTAVIRCLKHNEVYELPKRQGLDCAEMFELFEYWFKDLDDDAISPRELTEELEQLIADNQQVGFARQLKELCLDKDDLLLLTLFCHSLVNRDDNDIRFGDMEEVFSSHSDFNSAKGELRNGTHYLQKMKLIEHRCEDGIADTTRYKLTENAKRTLLAEMKLTVTEEHLADMLQPGQLAAKQMFYPEAISRQVDELTTFLQPENYQKIHERMQQKGFRQGFACLFYGSPGTGKTETVYQLARQTGRQIMVVDVPQIKSKWVGESEKNIKALFERYREQVKRINLSPILLFNEADAIIGIRQEGAQRAVEKMENSIQNIILQEMESLDGIMIATTNLQQNLDKAFERRFLYKIKFEKPNAAVRRLIWQQMIPEIKDHDAARLAELFDFSGGQIENIARKYSINSILHGDIDNPLELLTNYCNEERILTQTGRKIGF
jgi:SpoVK/Ycf46/Vps4 family AAA+-type ATPase